MGKKVENILITGANGFIGQALCKRMLADGYQVRGAVRGTTQMTALVSGVEGVMVGDIGPETDWSEALAGIDGVVHLAARVHVMRESSVNPLAAYREVNVEGTKCLAITAANAGVKRFVYISSVKVNGERTGDKRWDQGPGVGGREKTKVRGQEGELKGTFSEKDVPEPQDPYGISKWEAEQVLRDVAADTGLEVVILRPPLVYGPEVRGNFLRLLRIVWRGIPLPLASIKNRRSLIYIGNFVDAIVNCITNPSATGKTYLLSDGDDVSTPELIKRIAYSMRRPAILYFFPSKFIQLAAGLLGKSAIVDRLVSSLTVNISKIKRNLNRKPPYTMEEGIRETVSWYKSADYAD
ncbi:MAG: SDR family oxidoreductase [Deltaproteobacteria bacterium]|nr:SDR family oxidoreductase [Deltaproteobacteria bacterium]